MNTYARNRISTAATAARRIVKAGASDGVIALSTAASDKHVGVTLEEVSAAGDRIDVAHAGVAKCACGDDVAFGDYCTSDDAGKAVPATNGQRFILFALEDGAEDEEIDFLIVPGATLDTALNDGAAGEFTAGDWAPATVQHDAVYAVPTTAANSTITLPAAAPDGTRVYFVADGTNNGHTVQYRDATGPANLTAAATASKRHMCTAIKEGAAWYATLAVSP